MRCSKVIKNKSSVKLKFYPNQFFDLYTIKVKNLSKTIYKNQPTLEEIKVYIPSKQIITLEVNRFLLPLEFTYDLELKKYKNENNCCIKYKLKEFEELCIPLSRDFLIPFKKELNKYVLNTELVETLFDINHYIRKLKKEKEVVKIKNLEVFKEFKQVDIDGIDIKENEIIEDELLSLTEPKYPKYYKVSILSKSKYKKWNLIVEYESIHYKRFVEDKVPLLSSKIYWSKLYKEPNTNYLKGTLTIEYEIFNIKRNQVETKKLKYPELYISKDLLLFDYFDNVIYLNIPI